MIGPTTALDNAPATISDVIRKARWNNFTSFRDRVALVAKIAGMLVADGRNIDASIDTAMALVEKAESAVLAEGQ